MEMPTPCPTCDRTVEFNDMNPCDNCMSSFCDECLERPWGICEDCSNLIDEEEL